MIFTEVSDKEWLNDLIDVALAEDIGGGDVTTDAIIGDQEKAKAVWIAKQDGVVAGLDAAKFVFQKLDEDIDWNPLTENGDRVKNGDVILEFNGNCRAILTAERTALNISQRMSGISTKTAEIVRLLDGFSSKDLRYPKNSTGFAPTR